MPTVVFLSPHLDDAAFSCGGLMARLAEAGWHVVHATLFTATVPDPSGFALECQLDKGIGEEVDYMALRRDEDHTFAERIGASSIVHGPFPEAPHRGYSSAKALFGPVRGDDPVLEPLCDYLRTLLQSHDPNLLVAPQAIGGHVDHVQLVNAVSRVASLHPCPPVVWYRDAPYVIEHPCTDSPFSHISELDPIAISVGPVLQRKLSGAAAYASQLELQFARRFSDRDWGPSNFRPDGDRQESCDHQRNRRENREEGEIAMRRALSHFAFEEAQRTEGSTDGDTGDASPRDRSPLYDADLSAAERFRGDADAAETLKAFVLGSKSA